jgi:PAS domain S-box-containing protein
MLQLFSIISISCITSGNKVLLNKSNTYLREFIAKWKNIKMFHSIDTTNQFNIQNQYKNLIENANDIIFETDKFGYYIFINKYTETLTGYNLNELYAKQFSDTIRNDYRNKVIDFYKNSSKKINEFPTMVFPIIKKNGETIWLSQNVIIKRNEKNKIIGFTGIARDITLLMQLENEKFQKIRKVSAYNDTLKNITLKRHIISNNFEETLTVVLKIVAQKVGINRISYWSYEGDQLKCIKLYLHNKKKVESGLILYKKDYPKYFKALENEIQIVSSNVCKGTKTKEFCLNYFPENNIKSLLDTPIIINRKLTGVLCLESTFKTKFWDNEDINFAKAIADVLSITIETQKRQEAEKKLFYKNEILSVIT